MEDGCEIAMIPQPFTLWSGGRSDTGQGEVHVGESDAAVGIAEVAVPQCVKFGRMVEVAQVCEFVQNRAAAALGVDKHQYVAQGYAPARRAAR